MNRIKLLSGAMASRIAAGEVVTSPASVVKELVENSIDAGATSITVEIENGGRDLIRVTDNGVGIHAEDVALAVEKHATSKIADIDDLDAIATLGFRGEALFSMAAVSRFTVSTRTKDSIAGTVMKISGGANRSIMPAGLPEGTTVKVEQLFYNVPARQKFLVSSRNEAARVSAIVSRMILSHPELAVKYINNGSVTYQSRGGGALLDALITVYGNDIADKVTELSFSEGDICIHGYISKPSSLYKKANNITFILNGRYISSKLLHDALIAGYGERLLRSHFPFAVINITLPPGSVDVNVHPNKTQVLFSDEAALHGALMAAVEKALEGSPTPELKLEAATHQEADVPPAGNEDAADQALSRGLDVYSKQDAAPLTYKAEQILARDITTNKAPVFNEAEQGGRSASENAETAAEHKGAEEPFAQANDAGKYFSPQEKNVYDTAYSQHDLGTDGAALKRMAAPLDAAGGARLADSSGALAQTERFEQIMDDIITQAKSSEPSRQTEIEDVRQLVDYTVIGQAFNTYLVVEYGETLYFIDQHAAHERINYEEMKRGMEDGMPSQQLLTPYIKKFSQSDFDLIADNVELLSQLGFELEEFGPLTYKFSALPTVVEHTGMDSLTDEVVSEIKSSKKNIVLARDRVIQAACKHSIKAGDALSGHQISSLLKEITAMQAIPACPHGRPVAIAVKKSELQKGFMRIV